MGTLLEVNMDWVLQVVQAGWDVLVASAPYMLLGFSLAGVLKAFLPDNLVARHLGTSSFRGLIKAAAVGVPIPLCSCGVLPTAAGLRRQGAAKGPTAAFLISTPETGVDSMAVTWALLDPFMTVVRPLSALGGPSKFSFQRRIFSPWTPSETWGEEKGSP